MLQKVKNLLLQEEAQGMVEYILIIAIVAIIAIAGLKLFGSKIVEWFKGSADKIDEAIK